MDGKTESGQPIVKGSVTFIKSVVNGLRTAVTYLNELDYHLTWTFSKTNEGFLCTISSGDLFVTALKENKKKAKIAAAAGFVKALGIKLTPCFRVVEIKDIMSLIYQSDV